MGQRVLAFFPHNPSPQTTGAHKRCLQMLAALVDLGCSVTLFGSTTLSNTPWNGVATQKFFRSRNINVLLHRLFPFDFHVARCVKKLYRPTWNKSDLKPTLPLPPGMTAAFRKAVVDTQPEIIWMNYACWDGLLRSIDTTAFTTIVDTHDLITVNMRMQRRLSEPLARLARDVPDEILEEHFLDRRMFAPCPDEFDISDKYDFTIAISEKERAIIRHNTRNTDVRFIPIALSPVSCNNTYAGPPLLALGGHLFNLHGLHYFVRKVLPSIVARVPSFSCWLTGPLCHDKRAPRSPHILPEGFVPSLAPYYREAAFALCPVLAGTGQQMKIVEAMAHGLAVVAMENAADGSPLKHGLNGLVARDAYEFAEHTLTLLQDSEACRKLGRLARDTIASELSHGHLIHHVSLLLH